MTITPQPGIMDIALYVGGQSRLEGHASPLKLSSNENWPRDSADGASTPSSGSMVIIVALG